MTNFYLFLKLVHTVAFISWMVGMFYLPRLFVYHSQSKSGTDTYNVFCTMEKKLLRIIMNPAMIITWILGLALVITNSANYFPVWLLLKILLVLIMSGLHGFFSVCQRNFYLKSNRYSSKFYRIINEAPTVLLILILFLVIFKPSF